MQYLVLKFIFAVCLKILDVLLKFNRQSFYLLLTILIFNAITYSSLYFNNSKKITLKTKAKSQKYAYSKQKNKKRSIKVDEVRKNENVQTSLPAPIADKQLNDISEQMVKNEVINMDQNEYYRPSNRNQ